MGSPGGIVGGISGVHFLVNYHHLDAYEAPRTQNPFLMEKCSLLEWMVKVEKVMMSGAYGWDGPSLLSTLTILTILHTSLSIPFPTTFPLQKWSLMRFEFGFEIE